MKKFWKIGLSLAAAVCMALGLSACVEQKGEGKNDDVWSIDRVYALAKEKGFEGTLEELIALFKGDKGDKGEDGVGIKSAYIDERGHLILVLTDGTEIDAGEVNPKSEVKKDTEGLSYQATLTESGKKAYEVVGLGEAEGSEIVIPATYEGAPVEKIGDYAFCAEEKISESAPVALMILVDASGSMQAELPDGRTKLELAIEGALAYVDALGEKDYCGVGAFNDQYTHLLCPTPVTEKSKIRNAINSIPSSDSGTIFYRGIQRACELLCTVQNVEARHIVIITDGIPGDSAKQTAEYLANLGAYYQQYGITCSVGGVDILGNDYESKIAALMNDIANAGHGSFFNPEVDEFTNACISDLQNVKESVATQFETKQCDTACKKIQSVTISENVTSIGAGAFAGCENLTEIIFNGTKKQWNAIKKGTHWDYNTGDYIVRCTDGEITKA